MTGPGPIGTPGTPPPRDDHAQLRKLSQQLEGVFIGQLFQAMRQGVNDSGLLSTSSEEQLFTGMLDDAVAARAAEHMKRGIAEALYHQLARRLDGTEQAP